MGHGSHDEEPALVWKVPGVQPVADADPATHAVPGAHTPPKKIGGSSKPSDSKNDTTGLMPLLLAAIMALMLMAKDGRADAGSHVATSLAFASGDHTLSGVGVYDPQPHV